MKTTATAPHGGQPIHVAGTPLGSSPGVMVMLHGRGASAADILDLVAWLDRPDFTYLAPDAADHSWYPFSFMTDTRKNEPALSSALQVVGNLVSDLESRGVGADRVILLGFSQGACLSTEFAVRHPRRYGGVMALSGALIGAPGTTWNESGTFDGTPIFLGCSDVDAHIPVARVDESAAVFSRMGGAVTKRFYPGMGHLINEDEVVAVRAVMDRVLSGATR
jgi:phospholipase/carboxylesterase